LPDHLHVQPMAYTHEVTIHRLEAEAHEMWSFVKKKANKQWLWLAMDAKTRQVMAFHVGDRRRKSAKRLWANMPGGYRQHGEF
jgi:insertion element IS1 protein InsB